MLTEASTNRGTYEASRAVLVKDHTMHTILRRIAMEPV